MHSASETESDGQSESEAEFQEEAKTNIEGTDDTGFAPEAESLDQDMNALQQQVFQHSQATQQQQSQVTSFIS